jgi:amino acid adenylation domain-containing protein
MSQASELFFRGQGRPVPPSEVCGKFPLSFAQERLWVFEQLYAGSTVHHVPLLLRVRGQLDIATLEKSLAEVMRRHECLRTVNGQALQVPRPAHPPALRVADLVNLPETREERARQVVQEETGRPFDLAQGPLLRALLLRMAADDHLLLLVSHRIALDAYSEEILLRDLFGLYERFETGQTHDLPECFLPYADFAKEQCRRNQNGEFEKSLQYWRRQLHSVTGSPELPIDNPRPTARSFHGDSIRTELSRELFGALTSLSEHEKTSLELILLAAFECLLYRYCAQEDIVIGMGMAGRTDRQWKEALGPFASWLPVRTSLAGHFTFREVLERVREAVESGRLHADVPFDRIVKELNSVPDAARHPLFQISFVASPPQTPEWNLSRIRISRFDLPSRTTEFDLTVRIGIGGKFEITIEYASDLFQAATIARMAGHYQTLLSGIVSNPDQCLSRLPLLTQAERHQLLMEWNNTQANYPRNRCVHQLFEAQADKTPEATAVVFEKQQLTYSELNRRANRLAHHLVKLGVGPDVLVGICVERSLDMVVGLLAILKAGGAYVPLDPAYPLERLSFMLEDAELPVLLTQDRVRRNLPESSARIVCLDTDWNEIEKESTENSACKAQPENLAYVIYTSGSTGKPKGVQIPHRAVVNFLTSMRVRPGMTADDRLLAVTTLSFDIAGLEIYLPLSVGASVEIVSRTVASDGNQLLSKLASSDATVVQATPPTWRMLLSAGWKGGPRLKILCGGEALSRTLADQLLQSAGSLWNMYGPTETTIWSTTLQVEPARRAVPIGRPIANTQTFVLDGLLQPVPVGIAGELYIGGDGLARGYLKRPELTAEKFIPNPFSQKPAARLYKTGDMARYLPSGDIEFLGRIDHQVKIRGFRIELGEIESVLAEFPGVREAVVLAREDRPGDKRLVAYLLTQGRVSLSQEVLRTFLRKKLPGYMIPSTFVLMERLPLSPNGKLDRKALPAPNYEDIGGATAYMAPRNATEQKLEEIWSKAFHVPRVSIRDNFFDMGGDSLLAVGLITEIATTFGKELSFNTLLQASTIEQLALYLTASSRIAPRHSLTPIQPLGSKPPLFYIPGGRALSALPFRETALLLGSDQPVYGVESRLPGKREAFESVSVRSKHYLALIRSVQPRGPYYLLGYCLGGLVAYEMAQKLRAQGERVAFLALVECSVPDPPRSLFQRLRSKAQRSLNWHEEEVASETEMLDPTFWQNQEVMEKYRPRAFGGKIHLFLAEDYVEAPGASPTLDKRRAWLKLVDSYEVRVVPGDHHSMLIRPKVLVLAQELRLLLEAAQRHALEPLA